MGWISNTPFWNAPGSTHSARGRLLIVFFQNSGKKGLVNFTNHNYPNKSSVAGTNNTQTKSNYVLSQTKNNRYELTTDFLFVFFLITILSAFNYPSATVSKANNARHPVTQIIPPTMALRDFISIKQRQYCRCSEVSVTSLPPPPPNKKAPSPSMSLLRCQSALGTKLLWVLPPRYLVFHQSPFINIINWVVQYCYPYNKEMPRTGNKPNLSHWHCLHLTESGPVRFFRSY